MVLNNYKFSSAEQKKTGNYYEKKNIPRGIKQSFQPVGWFQNQNTTFYHHHSSDSHTHTLYSWTEKKIPQHICSLPPFLFFLFLFAFRFSTYRQQQQQQQQQQWKNDTKSPFSRSQRIVKLVARSGLVLRLLSKDISLRGHVARNQGFFTSFLLHHKNLEALLSLLPSTCHKISHGREIIEDNT